MDSQHLREADKEFDRIFSGLRSKNEEEQLRHALTLKNIMFDGGSPDQFNFLSESFIYNKLHEISILKDTKLKVATYYSIKAFINLVGGPELETSRFARLLDAFMNIPLISKQVADTLGSLYRPGWSLIATYFSFACGNAIENLNSKVDNKKLNSILILQSFTKHNPTALYTYIEKIFNGLYITLKDTSIEVRRESAELLERCLKILYNRDNFIYQSRFDTLYEEALNNLKSSSTESIHSSFLIFKVLLKIIILSNTNQSLAPLANQANKDAINFSTLTDKVDDIYNKCWFFKDYKSSTIRTEVIEIIPFIAKFNSRIFTHKYLQSITDFYMLKLKKDKDRLQILILFGSISPVIGSTNCLLYAKNLITVIENLLYSVSNHDSSNNSSLNQATEAFSNLSLNSFSSFNPSSHIFASSTGSSTLNSTVNAVKGPATSNSNGNTNIGLNRKKDRDAFSYAKSDMNINNSDPATSISFQNISEYKGINRYELERAVFFVLIKLCETLDSKITQVLTLNLIDLIIYNCNLTPHLEFLIEKLIELYPNLESFILQKLLNKITLILAGCEFIEPGVSISSLNLSARDKKKLLQKSVIGVHFDSSSGRVFLNSGGANNGGIGGVGANGNSNTNVGNGKASHNISNTNNSNNNNHFGNNSFSAHHGGSAGGPYRDEITGAGSRSTDLRRKIAMYRQPYNIATAPLSNYNIKDLSSSFNNFTAAHEAHSMANHTGMMVNGVAGSDSKAEQSGTHFITIKDMMDLKRAQIIRSFILKDYGFTIGGSANANTTANGMLSLLTRLTGFSDDYYFQGGSAAAAATGASASSSADQTKSLSGDPVDSYEYQESALLIECFNMLHKYKFSKYVSLFEYARYVTLTYIDHQDAQVRKLAALITTKLFSEDEIINSIQIGSITAVSDVLSKLLLLGVTDPIPEIRLSVLMNLNAKYDPQLAQSDNVRLLLIALNDEDFEVRKTTIKVLGRVSNKNPAYVVPALRKVLIQYLNNLKYGTTNSVRETNCSLLTCLVSCARMLTKPHISAIMETLVPLVAENKNSVICSIAIRCIGELARVSGESIRDFLESLIPLILQILKDNSLLVSKREKIIAVKTLSQLTRSSGKVIDPYFTYPDLLAEIIEIVSDNNADPDLKRETIKLQGILGALDPYKARELESNYKSIRQNRTTTTTIIPGTQAELAAVTKSSLAVAQNYTITGSLNIPAALDTDYSNYNVIAKNWGHYELGVEFDHGVDLNEMLNLADSANRIPKIIQMETPIDLLLLMQLNIDLRPLSGTEDYYLIVVLVILVRLLKDQSASSHHETVMSIVVTIFSRITDKCLNFTKIILRGMVKAMTNYTAAKIKLAFQQIGEIVKLVGKYVRPAIEVLLQAVIKYFDLTDKHTLIKLVVIIAKNIDSEFKMYVPSIILAFLNALNNDTSRERFISRKIIDAFVSFSSCIEEYFDLIISNILRFIENGPFELRKAAIESIGHFTASINLTDFASRIIHPFLRILNKAPENIQLRESVMNSLCALIVQLKGEYFIFLPIVDSVLSQNKISSPTYTKLVHQLIKNENVSFTLPTEYQPQPADREDESMRPVDVSELQPVWQCYHCKTKGDWIEWLKDFNLKLLKFSPSISLNSCEILAYAHAPVARELFNAAFAAVWVAITDDYRADLAKCLYYALQNAPSSSDVLQTILNLSEFMEHNNTRLPISISILSKYSFRHHAFAKALHYKEIEFKDSAFQNNVSVTTVDSLININNSLQQSDSGIGMLKIATNFYKFEPKESWFQKLQRWNEALSIYEKKIAENNASLEVINGKMSCLHALGQWEQLESFTEKNWNLISNVNKEKVAPLAAAAAWGTSKWNKMDDYINVMKEDSANKYFFNAILNVHRCNYGLSGENIRNARELLSNEITSLINESYSRAYDVVVRIQMLSDLEEIIEYKQLDDNNPRKRLLRASWDKRLYHCQGNVDIWQRLLNVRSLVIEPEEDLEARIKFANLCRKSGRIVLAEKTLSSLKKNTVQLKPVAGNGNEGAKFTNPALVYAQLKLLWEINQREKAWATLCTFTYDLSAALCLKADNLVSPRKPAVMPCDEPLYDNLRKILCKCFLKQGQWQIQLNSRWTEDKDAEGGVLGSFLIPTILHNDWYKGWHYWALANFEVISSKSTRLRNREDQVTPGAEENDNEKELVKLHAIPAIKGFFRSIELSSAVALQDLLRLLDLWFAFGGYPEAANEIERGINDLSIETWLQVLPQLFSRLHHPDKTINTSLQKLIVRLAEVHPQALLFPLNVSVRSTKKAGQTTAHHILNNIKLLHPKVVSEAELIVTQLVKAAMLLTEMWFHRIEEAVGYFQSGHHYKRMIELLDEVYQYPRVTFYEKSFWAVWGNEITRGYEWLVKYTKKFEETGRSDISLLQLAFDCLAPVHNKLNAEFNSLKGLYLEFIAPELLRCHDLDLAIPGTYQPGKTVIGISKFIDYLPLLVSKQRPRRLFIRGQDGRIYDYVLKGQEDIRQDNMVMQLFGLVNRFLDNDPECFKRHLNLEPYPTVPLSPKSGLLGWVPNSDTFHQLIMQNRNFKGVPRDIERRTMNPLAAKCGDNITILRKLEMFLVSLGGSRGMDIYEVLWLKSRSSEVWLERRTTYIRSLASMSMVGYVLGLGDRHPSNIMIHRVTGKVIHIDYGDCFEAAALREKWPEKVPFRLTRMLVNALEASGIEGSFRITLDHVVRVLRSNSESLLALFESFAHDPLINWGFDIPTKAVVRATGYNPPEVVPAELLARGKITEEQCDQMEEQERLDLMDARAQYVLRRIGDKLTGNDFAKAQNLTFNKQVDKLIMQATDNEGLCQHFVGWCAFW